MIQKEITKNAFWGIGGQIIIMMLGFLVPRLMITGYGSDINGLIGTVTQIYTYMALLEAGIGQAAKNALYRPINEDNRQEISRIASIAQCYFRKITVYYGIGVVLLSVILPLALKSEVDSFTIFMVVLLQGLAGVIAFYYIQTPITILTAYGRGFVNSKINTVSQILSYAAKIGLAFLGINIIFLQLTYFIITIAKVVAYRYYFRKNYNWLKYEKISVKGKLRDRNAYILSEIAWTIFTSTDMIVLSVFVSTQLASVYSIYNMVYTGIATLLSSVWASLSYLLGRMYHEDINKYRDIHDTFITVYMGAMTILMSVAQLLILPFVGLYTDGVSDISYLVKELPVLFGSVQLLSCSRYVVDNLAGLAGYARKISRFSVVEAISNVVLSVILVNYMGIVGVLVATLVSLPIKVVYCFYIADKKVLKRSSWQSIKIICSNFFLYGLIVWVGQYIWIPIQNYGEFALWGIVLTCGCSILGVTINILANPNFVKTIKSFRS